MNPLYALVEKIQMLDAKHLLQYGVVVFLVALASIVGVHFLFVWRINTHIKHIVTMNAQRGAIGKLLMRKSYVDAQRHYINAMIEKEPYFYIKEYYYQVIHSLGLDKKIGKGGESVSEQTVGTSYAELIMAGALQGLNTKELIAFLTEIESNPRVYLKEVKIINSGEHGIDINYVVAALKMK